MCFVFQAVKVESRNLDCLTSTALQVFSNVEITIILSFNRDLTRDWFQGDGVGPEIAESVTTLFKEMSVPVEFETIDLTKYTLNDEGAFNNAITSLKRNGVGLKGWFLEFYRGTATKALLLFVEIPLVLSFTPFTTSPLSYSPPPYSLSYPLFLPRCTEPIR